MAESIQDYLLIVNDADIPPVSKPSLQQYDNYQIYSIVGIDYPHTFYILQLVPTYVVSSSGILQYTASYDMQGSSYGPIAQPEPFTSFVAYQQYNPTPIPVDFQVLADKISVIQPKNVSRSAYISGFNVLGGFYDPSPTPIDTTQFRQLQSIADLNNSSDPNQFSFIYTQVNGGAGSSYQLQQWVYSYVGELPVQITLDALLDGYGAKLKPSHPTIVSTVNQTIIIEYYQINRTEPIPVCRSIDWISYTIELKKDVSVTLPILDVVFGTLLITGLNSSNILSILDATCLPNEYKYSDLLPENIDTVIAEWISICNQYVEEPPYVGRFYGLSRIYTTPIMRVLAANNNYWGNASEPSDVNFDANHPMFQVNDYQAYEWHVRPQSDGSYGNLIMNSPLLINIGRAVDAGTWGVNLDDPDLPRVDNLGWRTNRICEVLGIRVKPDGTIDEPLEKKDNRRQHAEREEQNDPQEYNPNCFGSKGMLVRYLPNKFKPKGKDVETIEGGFRKVKDIPQLLAELHEQANAAMGYQEGTAIEITVDEETYRYPNQLALLTEIFVTLKQSGAYSKGAFFSSVVAEQSIKEVIGGLGLRTVDKYLEFKIAGKTAKLYYKGISASQSIRRKLSAISTNIGTIIGNIT